MREKIVREAIEILKEWSEKTWDLKSNVKEEKKSFSLGFEKRSEEERRRIV